jgi:biotin carboxyl carrier protein
MRGTPIPVIVANAASAGTTVRAPMVGLWFEAPVRGAIVTPGSRVGTLVQLGRRFELVVPDGVSGRVAIEGTPHDGQPVEYGQTLFGLTPISSLTPSEAPVAGEASAASIGVLVVSSPTDGVFYRAPAVDAKPYVSAGDRVTTGQPVGLIEVMKTFNPIVYGGAGLPDEAEVVAIVAADGQEVRAGQALVNLKRL